ncbi:39S ribosomal protein L43, mitochondrial [Daktulosphaira vitifoliae]|uniref:39S ribosomal protein L43, mitochondrial n=1 Tax=Daktulosphaira vitifoliae TaxID=58002 RepID=UPI0021AA0EB6|nr:39S ribosomal protein L43, mitochondrial [Daktulosphaira vitifoliae]
MASNRFTPKGYPRVPLQNGIGRYICQLKRVTLRFCKSSGSSRGVRDFIESNLLRFAEDHSGTAVYLKPRRHKSPSFVAEYLNGEREVVSCHNFTAEQTLKWLNLYTTRSGIPLQRHLKMWHTDCPSIQGVWNPFTNRDPVLNVTDFPSKELSCPSNEEQSATDELLNMIKKQNLKNETEEENIKQIVVQG